MSGMRRVGMVVVLLMVGVGLWVGIGGGAKEWEEQLMMLAVPAAVLALGVLPPVRRVGVEIVEHIVAVGERRAGLMAVGVAVVSGGYFVLTAWRQGRYLGPSWHDEFSYLTQMQMLARGRLWMPAHEVGEFFDSFHIITAPVYASIYFPGTALLYVPTVWLGVPTWVMPVCAAAGVVGLTYWVVTRMAGGACGMVVAMMMVSLSPMRMLSTMVMSQVPVMLMGLLVVWGWMRWRESRAWWWAVVVVGVFAGWAAITRPLDAVCWVGPVGVGMMVDLWGRGSKEWGKAVGLVVVGAAPFLGLQVAANQGITGRWWVYPWQVYVSREFGMGKAEEGGKGASELVQKRAFREQFVKGFAEEHRWPRVLGAWVGWRMPQAMGAMLPQGILAVLLPLGVVGWFAGRRWVLGVVWPMFAVLYTASVFFTFYYGVVAAPAALMTVVLGAKGMGGRGAWVAGVWAMMLMAVAALPEVQARGGDQVFEPGLLRAVDRWEREHLGERAVVLFRFSGKRKLDQEPVHNVSTAWPDDARVILAHDLGERNGRIYRYYGKREPGRLFYLFDEGSGVVRYLGKAGELGGGH